MAFKHSINICFLAFLSLCFSSFLNAKDKKLIPETCVLKTEFWHVNSPQNKMRGTYYINNGEVTSTYDITFVGRGGVNIRHSGTFQGKLQGNEIIGTWQEIMHKWSDTYPGVQGLPCTCTRWGSWKVDEKITFNPDGTFSVVRHSVGKLYDDFQGLGCSEKGIRTIPHDYTDTGFRGIWRIGKEDVSVLQSPGLSEKERALAGYKRLLEEKKECEKYLNSPEAKIDYLGTHPESPTIMKRVKKVKDGQSIGVSEDTAKATPTESYRNRLSELNVLIPKVKKLIDAGKYKEALEAMSPKK